MIQTMTAPDRAPARPQLGRGFTVTKRTSAGAIDADVAAVARIDSVPMLLRIICDLTGMGFAVVARVTENSWTACSVVDRISFGLKPGEPLDVTTMLCNESRKARAPLVVVRASTDARYRDHPTSRTYGIESYISVPIVLSSGEYFGNLCAIDPGPATLSEWKIIAQFKLFAELIALHLENDRRQQKEQAVLLNERTASELREEFIAVLGHDLRNPLAGIAAGSAIIEMTSSDDKLTAIAQRISRSVKRMSALIDDTMDFARGRLGGGIGVEFVKVDDLGDAISAVVRELSDAHPSRALQFHAKINRPVYCDGGRIQQLFSNLLANALTHGSQTGVTQASALIDGDDVVLSVVNDGEPIAAENLPKVFSPFWRRTAASKCDGLGLGLYISAQIVQAHGGRLDVASSAEHGTQVVARIPLRPRGNFIPAVT